MTEKELKKLSKSELLEILLLLRRELDELRDENIELKAKLAEEKNGTGNEILRLLKETNSKVDAFCGWLLKEENSGEQKSSPNVYKE